MSIKKRRIFIIGAGFLVLLIIIFSLFFRKEKVEYVTTELQKQDITQTVSEIGTVKASQEIGLNFSQIGKLNLVYVEVGDQVKEGDVLAELDYSSLLIKKEEINAMLNIAKTNQTKLIKGASYEDIAVLEAQVSQAKSSYNSSLNDLEQVNKIVAENISQAEKNLNDLKASNLLAPMSVKQAVDSARINLDNVQKTSQQTINNTRDSLLSSLEYNYSVARSALDSTKRIMDDEDIENIFSVKNLIYKSETEKSYNQAVGILPVVDNYIKIAKANPSNTNIEKASDELNILLDKTFSTLGYCFSALENSIISSSFSQASLDGFKANVNTNKSLISASITAVQGAYFSYTSALLSYDTNIASAEDAVKRAETTLSDTITTAENTLSLARINGNQQILSAEARLDSAKKNYEVVDLQLKKLKTPAKSDDLKLAQAQVDQAMANLDLIQKQIEDNIIKSPINGKIVKINYEVGEQVNSSQAVISLLTENNFEIEVFISESDISKIKIGNDAKVTFDAFGDDYKINGQVYFIEPASTSISDVIYYKIKISFTEDELEKNGFVIKSGMTANIDIITNYKKDVLTVPSRSVLLRNDGERYIRVLNGKDIQEIPVTVGISGDQAVIEIFSEEIKEGDLVISSIKK